ncbi:unnamed protein product [Debaryomyces tyrocola]|nr:unnamed protein product [Debaryomyces tyrocola]
MVKALIAVTSYHDKFYENGSKTGVFVSEALHPFLVFKENDIEADFVSENGTFGYDVNSLDPMFLNGKDLDVFNNKSSDFNVSISKMKKASQINPDEYQIIFFPGGHGTAFDFPQANGLHKIAQHIWKNNGVIAAVSHGSNIFDGLYDPENPSKLLVESKTITGFTHEGEEIIGVDRTLKKDHLGSIEELCKRLGANFSRPDAPFEEHIVTDGRIITGSNPASAVSTALKSIGLVGL